jgi:hypothetical protein
VRTFLIVYDRGAGRIEELAEFGEDAGDDARRRRVELERKHRTDPNIEVVVLGAESLESLRVTHARYFKTPEQLVRG